MKGEETKQVESKENLVKLELQRAQVVEKERRDTMQFETEMKKRQSEYQVQLELQRDQQMIQQKEQMRR